MSADHSSNIDTTTCKNCASNLAANSLFCSTCGQSAHEHRLTMTHIFHELVHVFTHADKGIFFTIKELAYRAGFVATEYVEGKRKKYFNPFQLLLITSGVFTFLVVYFKIFETGSGSVINNGEIDVANKKVFDFMHFFFAKYFNFILLGMVPIQSFFSWLFFKKSKRNYAENLVFNTYITAELQIFGNIIFTFPSSLFPNLYSFLAGINFIVGIIFYIPATKYFFNTTFAPAILKSIAIRLVIFMVMFLILSLGILFFT